MHYNNAQTDAQASIARTPVFILLANIMIAYGTLVIGLIAILLSAYLMWRRWNNLATGELVIPTLYVCHILMTAFPALIFALTPADYNHGADYFLASALAALLIPAGASLADHCFAWFRQVRGKSVQIAAFPDENAAFENRAVLTFITAIAAACICVFIAYVLRAPHIPMWDLITGVPHATILERREEMNQSGYIFGVFRNFVMPLLFVMLLLVWTQLRGIAIKLVAAALIAMIFIYGGFTSQKTPIASLFVMGIIAYVMTLLPLKTGFNYRGDIWSF